MKKTVVVLAILFALALTGCNTQFKVSNRGVPSHVSHVEFWNGGTKILTANDATIEYTIVTSEKLIGASISFYTYTITVPGNKPVKIIDSEALAILYTE
jgi:hypothetical protein